MVSSSGQAAHTRTPSKRAVSVLGEELTKQPPADQTAPAPVTPTPDTSAQPLAPAAATGTGTPLRVAAAPAVNPPAAPATPKASNNAPALATDSVALARQPVVIHAFNRATFSFAPDPQQNTTASSTATDRKTANPVSLEVLGRAQGNAAALSVKVTNSSGSSISFPGGLSVDVTLSRDGSAVESTTASDPSVVTLAPSATAILDAQVPLSSYGSYALDGTLSYLGG